MKSHVDSHLGELPSFIGRGSIVHHGHSGDEGRRDDYAFDPLTAEQDVQRDETSTQIS